MKKTKEGRVSTNNIDKVEAYVLDRLNSDEVARLTERFIRRRLFTMAASISLMESVDELTK